ncbi:hypothetical protein MSAN_00854900 [Mycena sanguinolenta]|uniref:F-box domain-containing protein n=1 Tax=Mycena sanguinolenta TaxID=230812 RepID=A0A8H7DDU9_9AGAR|nr:hypothetical protein MSAN_00854900 [Mycena sanguinolenta]
MTSSVPAYTPRAPAEIWRSIFIHAGVSRASHHGGYAPFQPLRDMAETSATRQEDTRRLQTCLSIIRVCRLWHLIAAEFLYNDVLIMDSTGLSSLMNGLQRSAIEDGLGGFGRYIRRLELPMRQYRFTEHTTQWSPLPIPPLFPSSDFRLVDLLLLCPRLEIFCRPPLRLDSRDILFWAGLVSTSLETDGPPLLPCLRRLEWYETDLDTRFYGSKNTARLAELVAHAPALEDLFLSSDRPDALSALPSCPSLQTLRLNQSHYQSHHTKLPSVRNTPHVPHLTHLVLHTMLPSALLAFLSVAGAHLHVLEFAFAPQSVFSTTQMQCLLSRCPSLYEIAFYVGAPEIVAPPPAFHHPALRRARLKLSPEEWHPYKHVLMSQFGVLAGPAFPGLEEVVLHDSSRSLTRREVWPSLLRALVRRGCRVLYADGEVVSPGG